MARALRDAGYEHLSFAAFEGDLVAVKAVVAAGADVKEVDKQGFPPVSAAAQEGHVDVTRYLVEKGADIDQAQNDGCTPTYVAAQEGHVDVVRCLAENGANLNQAAKNGGTPTYIAAQEGHAAVVSLLAERRAAVDASTHAAPLLSSSQRAFFVQNKIFRTSGINNYLCFQYQIRNIFLYFKNLLLKNYQVYIDNFLNLKCLIFLKPPWK